MIRQVRAAEQLTRIMTAGQRWLQCGRRKVGEICRILLSEGLEVLLIKSLACGFCQT